jgi:hypothetical protein
MLTGGVLCSTMPQVMVVSSEGYFYSYNIDLENGGECSLMKQYSYVLYLYGMFMVAIADSYGSRLLDSGDESSND